MRSERTPKPDAPPGPAARGASGFRASGDGRSALAVTLVALVVGLVFWEPVAPGVWHDDGAYLLLGKSIADGEGLRYAGVSGSPPGAKFPPGYPALLSASWLLWPEATGQGAAASLLNVVLLALTAGLTWLVARRCVGLAPPWALVVLVPWLSADMWRVGMVALSEPLFLLTSVAAMGAALILERRSSARWLSLAAVGIAAAFHVRSVAVVLAVALGLALVVRARRRDAAVVLGVVALLVLPWIVWANAAAEALPDTLRDVMGPYGSWLFGQVVSDPGGAVARLLAGGASRGTILFSTMLPGVTGPLLWILGLPALGLALTGLVRGTRKGGSGWTLPLFVVGYLVILGLWPHQERRLLVPLLPWLAVGMAWLGPGRMLRGAGRWATLAWVALFVGGGSVGLLRGLHLESYRVRELMLARAMAAVEEQVPPDGVVGAPELWGGLHLHTGRPVAPSARFLPAARGAPWGSPEEQYRLWAETGIEYVVLELAGTVHKAAMDELDARCPGAVQLVASWGGGLLVRLAWDEACRARALPGG